MAKKKTTTEIEPELWERQNGETARAFEAFSIYRDMGADRSLRKVVQRLDKNLTTIGDWSVKYEWVKRAAAWDAEQDRIARIEMQKDIADTRKMQRKNAKRMQERGMEFLESVIAGEPALRDIVQLLKAGMEQERIAIGDVGEVIEERSGNEAISPVQIYIPDNNRGRDKDDFGDLEE